MEPAMINTTLAETQDVTAVLAIGGGLFIAFIAILGSYARSIMIGRSREQSRREIAAYVAEGSMSAEEGAKLMDAGMPAWERPKNH